MSIAMWFSQSIGKDLKAALRTSIAFLSSQRRTLAFNVNLSSINRPLARSRPRWPTHWLRPCVHKRLPLLQASCDPTSAQPALHP